MNIWFVTPFEGTELHKQAADMGYNLSVAATPERETRIDRYTYFYPETTLSEVPPQELEKLAQKTFLKFYLNPWRLFRILRLFPNKQQLPYLLWLFIKYSLKWS